MAPARSRQVLDGFAAVAHMEARITGKTALAEPVDEARQAIAAAIGRSTAGDRAAVLVGGADLASAGDLLAIAAGRHLPLVVHTGARAPAAHAVALGSGHEGYHACADTGVLMLFAANVQEALDLALVGRRTAEAALVPCLVAMDVERTARGWQDVELPSGALVQELIGSPSDVIAAPTPAQRMLFGEMRRRVPRWHDASHPALLGAIEGPESWAHGAIARAAFFDRHLPDLLSASFLALESTTGRRRAGLSAHRVADASILLVAQGAAIEIAEAAADHLRRTRWRKVGVLGVRCLRPFPGAKIAHHMAGKRAVAVLERVDAALAGDPPLLREIRAALDRAQENARHGRAVHSGYPAIRARRRPRLASAVYGLAGAALGGADVVALAEAISGDARARVYLGVETLPERSHYPKRQALLDELRRDYPELVTAGLRGTDGVDLRPARAVSVAVHRASGQEGEGLAGEAAVLLARLVGGRVRSVRGLCADPWGASIVDRVTVAPESLRDPGDGHPVDLAVVAGNGWPQGAAALSDVRRGGAVLVASSMSDDALWRTCPESLRRAMRDGGLDLYRVGQEHDEPASSDGSLREERLLGGLSKVLVTVAAHLTISARRALTRREEMLHEHPDSARAARLEVFRAGIEEVRRVERAILETSPDEAARTSDEKIPDALRRRSGTGAPGPANLSRFWSHVGVLYRDGQASILSPDPVLATGAMPASSAALGRARDPYAVLPVFDPERCTGCGRCWTVCPDGAIRALALDAESLVATGIRLARADALRPAKRLVKRVHRRARAADSPGITAGALLADDETSGTAPPVPEKRQRRTAEALERVREQIGTLPLARTEPFFLAPEQHVSGSGELLSIIVDPHACKGCGLCVAACEPRALECVPRDAGVLARAFDRWGQWERINAGSTPRPESNGERPGVDPIGAALLARSCLHTLPGGDGIEPGSGERLAVRLVLSITESVRRPLYARLAGEVADVAGRIPDLVRETLTGDLPAEDLEALAEHLEPGDRSSTRGARASPADQARLAALARIARGLEALRRRVAPGAAGTAPADFSLALGPGMSPAWAAFPHNAFPVPVVVDASRDIATLAAALLEAKLEEAAGEIALLDEARRHLGDSGAGSRGSGAGTPHGWRDLDPEARRLCPPLLLVAGGRALQGGALGALLRVLRGDLPIKVIAIGDLGLGLDVEADGRSTGPGGTDPGIGLVLHALATRTAFVAQSALSDSAHLLASVESAIEFPGPALVHLHAPSPGRHGFAAETTLARTQAAVRARAFPLLRYDPGAAGVFGTRISLDGNPEPHETWCRDDAGRPLTPADWALGEERFAAFFSPVDAADPAPLAASEYLDLDESARARSTPVITDEGGDGEPVRYRVEPAMIEAVDACRQQWRTLQELSGLVTPFTARIEAEIRERLQAEQRAALAELERESGARLEKLRVETESRIAERVTERLLAMAGYPVTRAGRDSVTSRT